MRSYLILGAAALVSASPAPQAFDPNAFDAIPVTLNQGPPVGPGVAEEKNYVQGKAQAAAAAAATGTASAQQAKRSAGADLEARWFFWKPQETKPPAGSPVATPAPTPAPTRSVPATNPSSTNVAPSSCTPVDWTNTYAFTSITACPTAIEVGTYCGFINPDDPCAAQPNAYGPPTTPDTVDAFRSNPVYDELAKSAKTPSGYSQAFSDLDASVEGSGYLSYKTLTSYDPAECAAICDKTDTCTGFNIFIERDPKWNPEKCSCASPSIAQIKCSLWGQDVKKETATNKGQGRSGFEVIIVSSNGYNKNTYTPPSLPGCSKPVDCGHQIHDHQPWCLGQHTFPGPFDPSLCAAYAQAQNAINKKSGFFASWFSAMFGNKAATVQFQASYLEKNGVGFGTHCRLFTKKFSAVEANLDISLSGTSKWGCQKSFTFEVDVNADFSWGAPWKRNE
jgi:hypothetical protein